MKEIILLSLLVLAHGSTAQRVKLSGSKGSMIETSILHEKVATHEADADEDILSVNKKFPGLQAVEGDMLGIPKQRNAIVDTAQYWTSQTIPIQFGQSLGLLAISGIEDSRQEYEMRTCLSFPDRTTESNYLTFEPLSGCWSYIGMLGGQQTVSIGSGCEGMSTVVHEIMHALGIYHEQSRTDRDDYITIETQNIDADKVYNFDKYGYDVVDDRRIAYDYDSVMHYGETAFSNNGQKTILTRDPKFQYRIGQRRTFSEGDVTMINRMYDCADPIRLSYTCNFDESTICGYVQDKISDDKDWLRYESSETLGSHVSSKLPQFDGTNGEKGTGSFMVMDTSNKVAGEKAYLTSMRHLSSQSQQCLEFHYYMDLEAGSSASLSVYLAETSVESGDILNTNLLTTFTQDSGAQWHTERLTIGAASQYKLVVEGISGGMANDVIAVDDINIMDKPCETAYFTVNDFTELVATSQKGDYLYGPQLYTDEGYAFQILMYPHGSSSAADGYFSIFFSLVAGPNDDNLQWPFHDFVVRFTLVDQVSDSLTRMNQHSSYLTSSTGGSAWEKPTYINSGWGYSNFMKLDEILNTRDFLKHDSIMISINVRNMNTYIREHAGAFAEPVLAEPILKTTRDHDHDNHHDHHHDDHRDINININKPQSSDEEDKDVSPALVGGVAFACAVGVFMLMSIVIVCMNQSHKQAMTAITIANHSARTKAEDRHFSNFAYQEEKI